MKKLFFLLVFVIVLGCSNENGYGCFNETGEIVQREFDVTRFKKIIIWKRVQLIVQQGYGRGQTVVVETGENLIDQVKVRVEDGILKVSDRNSCNFLRDFSPTKVYVTTPDLKEIRNSSGFTVESRGVLGFEDLTLISEDRELEDEFHIDGDFRLNLDVGTLTVEANGISTFYLEGHANNAFFGLYDGDVRVEAGNLKVKNINFLHRSTNKLIIYPVDRLRGWIRSLGDVIAKNRPPFVDVKELYTGRLIFEL